MIGHVKEYKRVYSVLTATVFFLGIGATVIKFDDRYAKAAEHKQVVQSLQKLNERIDQQSRADQMLALQKRIWQIEDRYRDQPMPLEMLNELRFLQMQLEQMKHGK